MKVAIVHDWIITLGGAERVLKELCLLYPAADVFTLICKEDSAKTLGIDCRKIKTSFLQNLPFSEKIYKYLLPLMPNAVESFDLSEYKLVISSSHCVAKGVLTNIKQTHIAYVYTPMRYAWDLHYNYLRYAGLHRGFKRIIAGQLFKKIRLWDLSTSNRPDYYIAISNCVAERIKKIYGKDSIVIYPPVDTERFKLYTNKENFYLTAGRLVPYKRVDIIVEAFAQLKDKKLIIIGDGSELKKLKSTAAANIEFLRFQDENTVAEYMGKAKAFIFAAEEDFGIMPVEAQACGTPVIAYRGGGVLETVIDGKTGIFFDSQTSQAIVEAIKRFEKIEGIFSPDEIRKNAERFSRERFIREFQGFVDSVIARRMQ